MTIASRKQESHEEQNPGEVFLGYWNRVGYENMTHQSKRLGKKVFDDNGREIDQSNVSFDVRGFPVFAARSEIEKTRRRLYLGSPQNEFFVVPTT